MEKEILEIYTDDILDEISNRYGIIKNKLKPLGDFENFVYEYENNERNFILRVTHSSHRNTNLVRAELDWISYLSQNGVSIPNAILSENDELVEVVEAENSYCIIVAFEKAKGTHPKDDDWNANLFQKWGQIVGQIHNLTKRYKPDNLFKREQWYEDDMFNKIDKYIPSSQSIVIKKCNKLIEHLYNLPTDEDSYGLIHTDVHQGNFFIYNGEITLFDFDDCSYKWFASDIAITLFYALWHPRQPTARQDRK